MESTSQRASPTISPLDCETWGSLLLRSTGGQGSRDTHNYIDRCAKAAAPMPVFGNGDILSYEDANLRRKETSVAGMMIGQGALIKPWIFTEIKEQRHWDISSSEQLDMLRNFTNYGLEQWGSDQRGVATTRHFLLEWLSFLYRYMECWSDCHRGSTRSRHIT
ncbi:tRNA-dihydrouridine(47) synthase [NAD(P)(+)]-like [Lamellibrachia satsuma]|nr:tRNA-dihydrouridine(47) synthase [NAD(P)(+)]-like [Lamellibrachia satsuma]